MRTTIGEETFGYFIVVKDGKYLRKYLKRGEIVKMTRRAKKAAVFTMLTVAENFARLVGGKVVDLNG